jgi:hypothetical protein
MKMDNGILLILQTDYNRLTTLGSTTVPSGRRTTKYVLSTGSSTVPGSAWLFRIGLLGDAGQQFGSVAEKR